MSRSAMLSARKGKGSFARGIHPHDWKELTADAGIEVAPTPQAVTIALVQHIGAANLPVTKPRQHVALGEKLGYCDAFVSAPVHASIAGVAAAPSMVTLPNGRHVPCVAVKAEGEQLEGEKLWDDTYGGDWPTVGFEHLSAEALIDAIRKAGLVGMGGAGFPTHVK
ncbi:MAG: electron transport complex subunit RsxC, partial [Planctomycetes bacterium]|nr:electron transport complex subunit RsxC [Planctomycetota bacterium]